MRDIYAQTLLVTVWLGPERDEISRALEFIREISEESRELEGRVKSGGSALVRDSSLFVSVLNNRLMRRMDSQEWRHSINFCNAPGGWWKRVVRAKGFLCSRFLKYSLLISCTPNTPKKSSVLPTLLNRIP